MKTNRVHPWPTNNRLHTSKQQKTSTKTNNSLATWSGMDVHYLGINDTSSLQPLHDESHKLMLGLKTQHCGFHSQLCPTLTCGFSSYVIFSVQNNLNIRTSTQAEPTSKLLEAIKHTHKTNWRSSSFYFRDFWFHRMWTISFRIERVLTLGWLHQTQGKPTIQHMQFMSKVIWQEAFLGKLKLLPAHNALPGKRW